MARTKDTGPFSGFEWMLALRYLRARRKEGFISVIAGFSFIGIMLGVATLIIVMAVMNGFRNELFDKILGLNGHMLVRTIGGEFTDYDEVAKRLHEIESVKKAIPLVEGQVMMSAKDASRGVIVRGIRENDLKGLESVGGNIYFGSLDEFGEKRGIVIGTRLANTMGVRVGDAVTLVSARGSTTPFGTAPRIQRYPVTAIFEIGMSQYDESIAFLPLSHAQAFFNSPKSVTALEVMLDNPDAVDTVRPDLAAMLPPNLVMSDWRERNATFYNTLKVERNVMFLILTLIVLVAALNIISGLIMLVKDKSSSIAILRTMGATRGAIMRVFFITGASIGVVGTLAGLVLGVLVCLNIEAIREFIAYVTNTNLFSPDVYFLSRLPADMDLREVATVVIMALSLSVLATLYPSWRAARLDPVEALRYE
ncbi:MAG: lipoprotein-releasing ABC transporter permease subunit [Dichotomicrobium sp.]